MILMTRTPPSSKGIKMIINDRNPINNDRPNPPHWWTKTIEQSPSPKGLAFKRIHKRKNTAEKHEEGIYRTWLGFLWVYSCSSISEGALVGGFMYMLRCMQGSLRMYLYIFHTKLSCQVSCPYYASWRSIDLSHVNLWIVVYVVWDPLNLFLHVYICRWPDRGKINED